MSFQTCAIRGATRELCFTDLSSFAAVDAADSRFVYRSSPVD
jgi:hypothetical protein